MTRYIAAAFLVVALQVSTSARVLSPSITSLIDDREAVVAAETAFYQAYVSHDVSALQRLMADTLSFTKENGYVSTKAVELRLQAELAKRPSGTPASTGEKQAPMNYQIRDVRLYGDTAVTTGSFDESELNGTVVRFHFTNTWIRRDDAWLVVATQISAVSEGVLRNLEKMPKSQ